MRELNRHQIDALAMAAQAGGAFVESLGKTDLARWSSPEWDALIEAIVKAFEDHLSAAYAEDPPF